MTKAELYNDNFQNYKKYGIPKAHVDKAEPPEWSIGGDTNGQD